MKPAGDRYRHGVWNALLRSFHSFLSWVRLIALIALLHPSHVEAAELGIIVKPLFGGEPVRPDSLRYTNSAKETLSFTRISFLISGFALEKESGDWQEIPGQTTWIDLSTHRLQFALREVPPAKYRAIRFYIGPDKTSNHSDISKIAPNDALNPNLNGLYWSWQGEYIFIALEGQYRESNTPVAGYSYHLAHDTRRTLVSLPVAIDLDGDACLEIGFDLQGVFNAPRPISVEKDGTATHSRDGDPLAQALQANLPGAFSVRGVNSTCLTAPTPPSKPVDLPAHFTPYPFSFAGAFPMPALPLDNPLIGERVDLGRKLFSEKAFSKDRSLSCMSCHNPDSAYSDPRQFSTGVHGDDGKRHSMPLFNLAWKTNFFWDGRASSLRQQVLMPVEDHDEMDEPLGDVSRRLQADPSYPPLFQKAFASASVTPETIALALEQFLLTITSYRSKFDMAIAGVTVLSPEEKRGFELFMTEYDPRTKHFGADCFHCHGGPLFTDHQFHNTGLDDFSKDPGLLKTTGKDSDRGKFVTPSLRNVALSGPYMHDGRFKTLNEVVAHYSEGVHRSPNLDPNLAKHPVEGMKLNKDDQNALVSFLKSLTDPTLATEAKLK